MGDEHQALRPGHPPPGWATRQGLAWLCAMVWAGAGSTPLQAFEFSGERHLVAVAKDGQRKRVGSVRFEPQAQGSTRFQVRMDPTTLQDHFLSMREFKCIPAAQEITCFVPYPYPHPGTVSSGQFDWLEHSLLFFFKQPADFGAKLWNGVIFKFEETPGALVGRPQAVDLNRIGVPPEKADEPPFGRFDRDEFSPGARWIQELRIE